MNSMRLAELAILLKLDTIGIVLLVLKRIVIPLLADRAGKSYFVSAGVSHVSLRSFTPPRFHGIGALKRAPRHIRCLCILPKPRLYVKHFFVILYIFFFHYYATAHNFDRFRYGYIATT